jgi:hypothetical protein
MAYHAKIKAQFGEDLFKVLGPKNDRVKWETLSFQDQQKRLKNIPTYVSTRLGKTPLLIDIVIACLNELILLGDNNPLLGIDLPIYDSLIDAGEKLKVETLDYADSNMKRIDSLVKAADKQRDVFLRHIFEDIIFRFNPGLVLPGIGRLDNKGRLFVNDAQHRILGCIMLGIEEVPMINIKSDQEFWDVAQYAAINIHSLSASEFDRYRIRVQREIASREYGFPSEPEDAISYELSTLFDNLGIRVIEKSESKTGNSLVLSSIGNMIKYRIEYGQDHFNRATEINARLFTTSKFHTANSWGLMEFFKYQDTKEDKFIMDYALMNALRKRWKKTNSGGKMYSSIRTSYKEQTDSEANNSRVPEPLIIAHGIYQVCKTYSPDFNWKEPTWPEGRLKFVFPCAPESITTK